MKILALLSAYASRVNYLVGRKSLNSVLGYYQVAL